MAKEGEMTLHFVFNIVEKLFPKCAKVCAIEKFSEFWNAVYPKFEEFSTLCTSFNEYASSGAVSDAQDLTNRIASISFYSLNYFVQIAFNLIVYNKDQSQYQDYCEKVFSTHLFPPLFLEALQCVITPQIISTYQLPPRIRKDYVSLILTCMNCFFHDTFKPFEEKRTQCFIDVCKHLLYLLPIMDDTDVSISFSSLLVA